MCPIFSCLVRLLKSIIVVNCRFVSLEFMEMFNGLRLLDYLSFVRFADDMITVCCNFRSTFMNKNTHLHIH